MKVNLEENKQINQKDFKYIIGKEVEFVNKRGN